MSALTIRLTEQAAAWAREYAENGGDPVAAAEAVGYRDPARAALELLASPAVRAEMSAAVRRRATAAQAVALNTIINLATSAQRESVRLDAAKTILDRTGMPAVALHSTEQKMISEMSQEELAERIAALDAALEETRRSALVENHEEEKK